MALGHAQVSGRRLVSADCKGNQGSVVMGSSRVRLGRVGAATARMEARLLDLLGSKRQMRGKAMGVAIKTYAGFARSRDGKVVRDGGSR